MHEIIEKAAVRGYLLEPEAMDLLKAYSFPIQDHHFLADNSTDNIPETISYPVVVKVVSPQIIHKSDVGGVKVNIQSKVELSAAISSMRAGIVSQLPDANIHGWKVDPFVSGGLEIILGAVNDSQFGMTLMLGVGGVFTEVINDSVFRVVPVSEVDIEDMISELKTQVFFEGFRGNKPLDKDVLKQMLLALNNLIEDNPLIREVDLNPIICNGPEIIPVDARIILAGQGAA